MDAARALRTARRRAGRVRRSLLPSASSPGPRPEDAGVQATVQQAVPPGHFYSPIPDLDDVRRRADRIFDRSRRAVPGIDVRPEEQLALLEEFASYYADLPFEDQPTGSLRYGFENDYFSYGDGIALYSMLRHLRPTRVVEVGSGWSSALMLDVNDVFLDHGAHFTFIEPFPERLNGLLREGDGGSCEIIEEPAQSVALDVFETLGAGDLLLIDSTHVSRVGSDVNRLLLDVVPSLAAGVTVHVHDVFWPFEYPEAWVYEGRNWNEDYLLRALLVGNSHLQVLWFNSYLAEAHRGAVASALPLWERNPGGSIYLQVS